MFEGFYAFSKWIYTQTLSTWKISLERQITLLHTYLLLHHPVDVVEEALLADLAPRPEKTIPFFLRQKLKTHPKNTPSVSTIIPKRQAKRLEHDAD